MKPLAAHSTKSRCHRCRTVGGKWRNKSENVTNSSLVLCVRTMVPGRCMRVATVSMLKVNKFNIPVQKYVRNPPRAAAAEMIPLAELLVPRSNLAHQLPPLDQHHHVTHLHQKLKQYQNANQQQGSRNKGRIEYAIGIEIIFGECEELVVEGHPGVDSLRQIHKGKYERNEHHVHINHPPPRKHHKQNQHQITRHHHREKGQVVSEVDGVKEGVERLGEWRVVCGGGC
mmetsp:Transcript_6299/g.23732  ORF Transcript_6299/g.23732 Transcript_6299/m.23732 type:complete len:228 (-) Transcript_6299:99-782(-)